MVSEAIQGKVFQAIQEAGRPLVADELPTDSGTLNAMTEAGLLKRRYTSGDDPEYCYSLPLRSKEVRADEDSIDVKDVQKREIPESGQLEDPPGVAAYKRRNSYANFFNEWSRALMRCKNPDLTGAVKRTGWAVRERANTKTGGEFAGSDVLAADQGIKSAADVRRRRVTLVEAGWLIRSEDTRGRAPLFVLHIPVCDCPGCVPPGTQ